MMPSNNNDEDDLFAPNPFRTAGTGHLPTETNFWGQQQQQPQQQQPSYGYGQPGSGQMYGAYNQSNTNMMMPPVSQPYSQPTPFMTQQAQPNYYYGQQQPTPQLQQPPYMSSQAQNPDPRSGMTGTLEYARPAPAPVSDPVQYLSGTMDQKAVPRGGGGGPFDEVQYGNTATDRNNNVNNNAQNGSSSSSWFSWKFWTACCKWNQYLQYFDVDTADVTQRVRASLTHAVQPNYFRTVVIGDTFPTLGASPIDPAAVETETTPPTRKGPDLYGPFWICMTLVFLLGVTSNLNDYWHHHHPHSLFHHHSSPSGSGSNGNNNNNVVPYNNTNNSSSNNDNNVPDNSSKNQSDVVPNNDNTDANNSTISNSTEPPSNNGDNNNPDDNSSNNNGTDTTPSRDDNSINNTTENNATVRVLEEEEVLRPTLFRELNDPLHRTRSSSRKLDSEDYTANFHHLLRAFSMVFGFVFAVPTLFWLATVCLGMPGITWPMWICMYGYSMTAFCVAMLVVWIPLALFQWLVLGLADMLSFLLVIRNLSTPLLSQDSTTQSKAAPLIMSMLAAHVIYAFALKIVFYEGK